MTPALKAGEHCVPFCPYVGVSTHSIHPAPPARLFLSVLFSALFRLVEGEDEFGSDAFRTDDVDILVMGADDFFYDGKSETGALAVFSAGGVDLVKTIPDLGQAFFRDADAGILYGDKYFPVFFRRLDNNRRIIVGKFDRIVDEIVQNLLDLSHICADVQGRRRDNQADRDLS